MISEKTVELNLTTELVNWLFYTTRIRPYILAPSQQQEGFWGFDTSIGFPGGTGILIQYKRAYVNRLPVYRFHLNRTKKRDQHLRLQILESTGFPVYYAFPIFHMPAEIIGNRRRLLLRTEFVRPSRIRPIGGPTGHHEVQHNAATGQWTVHSDDEAYFEGTENFKKVYENMTAEKNTGNLIDLLKAYNAIFCNTQATIIEGSSLQSVDKNDLQLAESQVIFATRIQRP
jgi:hypothetical protein